MEDAHTRSYFHPRGMEIDVCLHVQNPHPDVASSEPVELLITRYSPIAVPAISIDV